MIDLTGVTKIEFTVKVGMALLTRNGVVETYDDEAAGEHGEELEVQQLMNMCSGQDPAVAHIEHNAATAADLEGFLRGFYEREEARKRI